MGSTKIEWTDATWNPVVGCSKASPGCANCYAETMARRLRAMGRPEYQQAHDGDGWTGRAVCLPERLEEPLRWRKPRRVFVCSMGDLFHPSVPFEFVAAVFGVMAACPQHTFQVLTKRPERMAEFFGLDWDHATECGERASIAVGDGGWSSYSYGAGGPWPIPNVWLLTTVENQAAADLRLHHLLRCPAAVLGVSVEPMISGITLPPEFLALGSRAWAICGGETGPGARRMEDGWLVSLLRQCQQAGVPFFYKGAGTARLPKSVPSYRLLAGRTWEEMPHAR